MKLNVRNLGITLSIIIVTLLGAVLLALVWLRNQPKESREWMLVEAANFDNMLANRLALRLIVWSGADINFRTGSDCHAFRCRTW